MSTRTTARWAAIAALATAASCSGAPPAPPPPPAPPARAPAVPFLSPAHYVVGNRTVVERTPEGIERTVLHGRRLEVRGAEIVSVGPSEPELDSGARAPTWAAGGAAPARYVFWKGKQLWGAESFLGPVRRLATLPQPPRTTFEWLDGTGILLQGGALVVPPSGGAPGRLGVAAVVRAAAADARLGVALTALGKAWVTIDGGATFRDASADLGGAGWLEAQGGAVVATLPGGRERVVTAAGAVVDRAALPRAGGPRPVTEDPDAFFEATRRRPLDVAVQQGVPTGDGGVVIAAHGFVGRFDVASLRTTSVAPLDAGLRDADCVPVRAGGAVLLACVGPEHAAVVDLEGAPRTERTFDLAGASDLERFTAGDDALAFLGPCDGTPPRVPALDQDRGGEPYNASRQQTPVLCVRAGRDEWVEHRLLPGEAQDLVAWIPRAAGGAVALLSRPAPFLDDRERVQVRGALRIVRLARTEPPLSLGPYSYLRGGTVDDALRVLADDTITGWLSSSGSGMSELAVTIDPAGHVHAHEGPPHARYLARSGPLALSGGNDGRLWETIDAGRHWAEVPPPPAVLRGGSAWPIACSPAGCAVGSFARIGWTGAPDPPRPAPVDLPLAQRPARERYRRPPLPAPVVRLSCAPAGPPEGRRIADSGGFGYTPQALPRTALSRVGSLGVAAIPWRSGVQAPVTDIDVSWMAPLDVAGVIRRHTVPAARLGPSFGARYTHDLRLGYLLGPDGGLSTFTLGSEDDCYGVLLEAAGITLPLGACAADPSVGVDLGGRVVVVHPAWGSLQVAVAEAPPRPKAGRAAAASILRARPAPSAGFSLPVALHRIHDTPSGGVLAGLWFGAGERGGAPVVVVVDGTGQATLAPIDPQRGTLGAEERLRPLSEAALGASPACSPRPGEARVVLPFEGAIALDRASIRGVAPASGGGVAVLRWSRDRVCLDAVELPVHDDRFDESPGPWEPQGTLRKVVARLDGKAQAALIVVGLGTETRQRLACTALLPGPGEGP